MFGLPMSLVVVILLAAVGFVTFIAMVSRYKRCPSDKILVVFGKVGGGRTSKCIHGGATFVWPLIQESEFLDLKPMTIDIDLQGALSLQNIRVNVPSRFTIGVSDEPEIMSAAAERLLSMERSQIEKNAEEIILGQLRATIATMKIESINQDREKFEKLVMHNVESELKKLGLKLINVNITDITDESGYINALGKKAASEAINQAKVEVAKQDRDGSIGSAQAKQDERVKVADANARAVEGENEAEIAIANSEAKKREAQAEALRKAVAAERSKVAQAQEEAYQAEQKAETKRQQMEMAKQNAETIVPAEIAKQKKILEAEALAEQQRQEGLGAGDKAKLEMLGQAEGKKAMLEKQAEGLSTLVDAAGQNPQNALQYIYLQELPKLTEIQAEAVRNIDFGKVVVWDSGSNSQDGGNAVSNFTSNLLKVLPPIKDVYGLNGMDLPEFLAKTQNQADQLQDTSSAEEKSSEPSEDEEKRESKQNKQQKRQKQRQNS